MTTSEERRLRSRDVPQACRVRSCTVPKGLIRCPDCLRPVFRELPTVILPVGRRL